MQKEKKVTVESIGRGVVAYRAEGSNVKRRWHKPGITKQISIEELENVLAGPGGEMLLTRFLYIHDTATREYLGLPLTKELMMNDKKMRALLEDTITPAEMKETVSKMYNENIKRMAELAIEMEIESLSKVSFLKEKSGIDIYKAIQDKRAEKKEKAGKTE